MEWAEVRSGLGADSNKQQLRGKRLICNNLLLYESDVIQGGGYVVSISLVVVKFSGTGMATRPCVSTS